MNCDSARDGVRLSVTPVISTESLTSDFTSIQAAATAWPAI